MFFLADFTAKDIKQDLCRLLVKGKDEENEKFEMKVGIMRTFSSSLYSHPTSILFQLKCKWNMPNVLYQQGLNSSKYEI